MIYKKYIIGLCLILFSNSITPQSEKLFEFDEFIGIVQTHHPIAYQAYLKTMKGKAYLTKAKGGFDPKLYGNASQKYFDGKQYYSHLNAGLKVPTWFGLEFQGGYSNNDGYYLNPEYNTPDVGLWNLGVTLNVGNGLFLDQRRAELRQAEIFLASSELEQKLMINQLAFDATVAYYDWQKAYYKVKTYSVAKDAASNRLGNVTQSIQLGDLPQIDSLKAQIQLQDRTLKLAQAEVELKVKKLNLETFLWQDGFLPLEMDSTLKPEDLSEEITPPATILTSASFQNFVENHPDYLMAQNNIASSKIDFRLKQEQLKPNLSIKYNTLSATANPQNYSIENYNWGASLSYPIFTRKARGDLKITAFELEEREAKLQDKKATINYKIQSAYEMMMSTMEQVQIAAAAKNNYELLLKAEESLFNIGESSLFMVNTRDLSRIDANLKWIEVYNESKISQALYDYQIMRYVP